MYCKNSSPMMISKVDEAVQNNKIYLTRASNTIPCWRRYGT